MGVKTTVVFTDLFGSTSAFEALGNAQATLAVTRITSWIAKVVETHGGRVVKMLGDGVLALFDDNLAAIHTVLELQRIHEKRKSQFEQSKFMPLRIGVASGDVEIVAGDCYGDAVNVASRLSDLSGPFQIWANHEALFGASESNGVHFRKLGPISIRGRAEPCTVYQVDWQEDVETDFLTMQASLDSLQEASDRDVLGGQIELTWRDVHKTFRAFEMPIHLGRIPQADFVVNDPRVSRTHARIEWRNGGLVLVDMSSYGSWVRFSGDGADLLLRREECALHGRGEIALGSSFADATAPTVSFSLS